LSGIPGGGKDALIIAALEQNGYQKFHKEDVPAKCDVELCCNVSMNIQEFEKTITQAKQNGWILVLQEINAAPSNVLEMLNDVMANPTPNFAVLATENPAVSLNVEQDSAVCAGRE